MVPWINLAVYFNGEPAYCLSQRSLNDCHKNRTNQDPLVINSAHSFRAA